MNGVLISVVVILILVIFLIIIEFNSLKKLQLKVEQSKSGIDIYLKERFDLIPNLVNIVKGYSEYEKEVFDNIANIRNEYDTTKDLKLGEELDKKISQIIMRFENYPDIKSNTQFLNLQENLSRIENQIQAARRIYNYDVTVYNTKIASIPSNIIANIFGFRTQELLDFSEARQDVNVEI